MRAPGPENTRRSSAGQDQWATQPICLDRPDRPQARQLTGFFQLLLSRFKRLSCHVSRRFFNFANQHFDFASQLTRVARPFPRDVSGQFPRVFLHFASEFSRFARVFPRQVTSQPSGNTSNFIRDFVHVRPNMMGKLVELT